MEDLKKRAENLRLEIEAAAGKIDVDGLESQHLHLSNLMQAPDFWSDNKNAQEISRKTGELEKRIKPWLEIKRAINELAELAEMGDESMTEEIVRQLDDLQKSFDDIKKELHFSGPYDDHDVILSIYAGAGGTDAQDWAQMLLRMYVRWAEDHDLQYKTLDQTSGEEAGIKSAQIEIYGGAFLYGKLAGEHGVHRLVRKSPFNSAGSRETSFARVEVLPAIDAPDDIMLDDKDLRVDVFRAGGHGGQSVNTTDSAVRITHIPTGITVAIQNERSQLQNKETALTILRSRLAQLQLEQHADKLEDLKGPDKSNEWGSQIRNYILDDRIVKDLRTGYESHDPGKILDGDLDPLIDAWLARAD